jgi:hypothetical protein
MTASGNGVKTTRLGRFHLAKDKASGHRLLLAYAISDSAADTIVDIAATVGASYPIVGAPNGTVWSTFSRTSSEHFQHLT